MAADQAGSDRFMRLMLGLAVVLLPFNSVPYLKGALREMANEAAFYPLAAAMLVWGWRLAKGRPLNAPSSPSFKVFLVFWGWAVLSGLANIDEILFSIIKGRSGFVKFVSQLGVLSFAGLASLMIYDVQSRDAGFFRALRSRVLASVLIAGGFSFFEILFVYGGWPWARSLLSLLYPLISTNAELPGRLRSVSGEPSWFGMYCCFSLPWVASYLWTQAKNRWVYAVLLVYMAHIIVMSYSRFTYVALVLLTAIYAGGLMLGKAAGFRRGLILGPAAGVVLSVFILLQSKNSPASSRVLADMFSNKSRYFNYNNSNMSRLGSLTTAYNMVTEHPFLGVGLGQYGFHMFYYASNSLKNSFDFQLWSRKARGTPWPCVNNLHVRIAAECGLAGLGIWLAAWVLAVRETFLCYRLKSERDARRDMAGFSLLVSLIGVCLAGAVFDSFRFFGYWILLGASWIYYETARNPPGAGRGFERAAPDADLA